MAQIEFKYSYNIPSEKVVCHVELDDDEKRRLKAAADLLEDLYCDFSSAGFKTYDIDRNNMIITSQVQNLHIYAESLYDVINMRRISNE